MVLLPASILAKKELGQQMHVTSIESHSAGISLECRTFSVEASAFTFASVVTSIHRPTGKSYHILQLCLLVPCRELSRYDRESAFPEKREYRPNVKIEYVDDDGRLLSTKEVV